MSSAKQSSSFRITAEKQESLVKLGILVLAAILCEFNLASFVWAYFIVSSFCSFRDTSVLRSSLRERYT